MDERSEGGGRFLAFVLIAALVVGLWLFMRRPATTEAVEQGIDPFVPTARQFDAQVGAVERARQVRDAINARTPSAAGAPSRHGHVYTGFSMIPLYAALGVCAFLAVLLVIRYDMYEREPWFMVALAAGLGYAAMWACGLVEPLTIALWPRAPVPLPYLAVVAGTHEELARLAIVAALALLVPRQFNDPMDGIIYGSIVGLGMAVEESLVYLGLGGPPPGPLLPASEPVRLMGHLVLGGISGFAVGMARMHMRRTALALAGCLSVAIAIHSSWDWIAFAAGSSGRMAWWQTVAAVTLMLGGMFFYAVLVTIGSEWSRRVFAPQQASRLWGWPFTLRRAGKAHPRRHVL